MKKKTTEKTLSIKFVQIALMKYEIIHLNLILFLQQLTVIYHIVHALNNSFIFYVSLRLRLYNSLSAVIKEFQI